MKMNRGFAPVLCLLIALLLVSAAFAQETTAGMQGVVKDPQGLVVSKAVVEVTSPKLIGSKKVETDASGYYRFANLPPGDYTITVTAQGFRTLKQTGITLATGHLPTLDLKLEVGGVEQTVEVSSAAPLVDVATSKVQTNVTSDVLAAAPKGRSFQSVIAFAPGARSEPLQGGTGGSGLVGYQIDGATNSENSYLVEGQETANIQTGASSTNVPMEFIQEVQIKSSGFEAEYGGALGGVVNVIQKRGGNAWHGSIFTYYQGDLFDSAPNRILRRDPLTAAIGTTPVGGVTKLDQPSQYYQYKKDHYRIFDPGFEAGGYLAKDRLWVFLSAVPRLTYESRTVNMQDLNPANTALTGVKSPGARTFNRNTGTYYSIARVDYLATQKIRLFGAWQYQYQKQNGRYMPTPDDAYGLYNSDSGTNPDSYNYGQGYRQPNMILNTGGDVTITPNLISTSRFGYFYSNFGDRGAPQGTRYYYRDTTYNYGTGLAPALSTTTNILCASGAVTGASCAAGGVNTLGYWVANPPAGTTRPNVVQPTGWFNFGDNTATKSDQYSRTSFSTDLAYFKKGWGTHNFKGGYAFNRLFNDVLTLWDNAQVYVAFGNPYTPSLTSASTGVGGRTGPGEHCADVEAENMTLYGLTAAQAAAAGCRGLWGTVNVRDFSTQGAVSSFNHSLYIQDAWTVGHGVTLNLGVRFDKESLPSYSPSDPGIDFGFGQKVAPRLGGSWDVFQNGKLKIYGSYGYFFDIMKYELPRGSFGGDYWHDCAYTLDDPNFFSGFQPTRSGTGNHYCQPSGPATGTITGGRYITNEDFRVPSNNPTAAIDPVSGLPRSAVDPNLAPMKSHELIFGADWAINNVFALETRWSRKRLDKTIEDAGVLTPFGEQYYITNPGFGDNAVSCTGCPANPKASRRYDGVEARLVKKASDKWYGVASYTWSRLYGNYAGLTATDVSDGGAGRNSPNVGRAFDEPFMSFDAAGREIDGPLPTDRTNAFKAYGYYRMKYGRFETLLGGSQFWYSGTPLSSYLSVWGAPVFTDGRGQFADVSRVSATNGNWVENGVSEKRTPSYSQTDLNLVQNFHMSKTNENLMLGFEANVTNLFNQHSPIYFQQNLLRTSSISGGAINTGGAPNYPVLLGTTGGYDWLGIANTQNRILSSLYGKEYGWQNPRTMRFKVKFVF